MRAILSTITFAAVFAVSAQQWCPPGAVWVYRYDGWGVDFRHEYRYVGDTIVDGFLSKHVLVTSQGSGPGGIPVDGQFSEVTRADDGVVWIWNDPFSGQGWDTLYWFGAQVGDRWWPPGHTQECPPHGMLEVVAVGQTTISGITLQQLTVVTIHEEGWPITPQFQIIERIGMTPRTPELFICGGAIDYYFPHFICYGDQDFQVPEGDKCQLTLGFPEPVARSSSITIHPNPGTTFQLTGLGGRSTLLRLLDMQGRVVREGVMASEDQPMDPGDLRPGTYLVEVWLSDGRREVLRWVRE
jgi:hypothetical protein